MPVSNEIAEDENRFSFNLAFQLPEEVDHDMEALDDAIWEAFPEDDPLVGIGRKDQVGIMFELEGESLEAAVLDAAKRSLKVLPLGSSLIKVDPELKGMDEALSKLM